MFVEPVSVLPPLGPTVTPTAADAWPRSTLNEQVPFAVGVTVYVAGRVVAVVAIVATGEQPDALSVGAGRFATVLETVKVCGAAPGPAKLSDDGVMDRVPGPLGPVPAAAAGRHDVVGPAACGQTQRQGDTAEKRTRANIHRVGPSRASVR